MTTNDKLKFYYTSFLLSKPWDYFFTVTFRSPRREPYYAMKNVWAELNGYENQLTGYYHEGFGVARAFMGVEPHASGDLHIHGLMSGRGDGSRPDIALPWDIWAGLKKKFGRNKVEACNSQEKVSTYCAKYVFKGQSVADHYEFFGSKRSWRDTF